MRALIVTFLLLFLSPLAQAEYYLRFTASGAPLAQGELFKDSSDTWLELTIIQGHPSDGPVHYEGSLIGSELKVIRSNNGSAYREIGVDHVNFYVADVPRSITIIDNSNGGSKFTLSYGDDPERLVGTPSVLMPDGLLVAPGLSADYRPDPDIQNIYVAAAMPKRPYTGTDKITPAIFPQDGWATLGSTCYHGWQTGTTDGESVEIWQAIARKNNSYCDSVAVYSGYLTHVVRYE